MDTMSDAIQLLRRVRDFWGDHGPPYLRADIDAYLAAPLSDREDLVRRLRDEAQRHIGRHTADDKYITVQLMLLAAADALSQPTVVCPHGVQLGGGKICGPCLRTEIAPALPEVTTSKMEWVSSTATTAKAHLAAIPPYDDGYLAYIRALLITAWNCGAKSDALPEVTTNDQQNALQSNVPRDCDCADARRYRWLRKHRGGSRRQAWAMVFDDHLQQHIDAALASEARDSTLREQTDAASGCDVHLDDTSGSNRVWFPFHSSGRDDGSRLKAERAAFEAAFRTYFGADPQPGFDQPADFWLEQVEGGRYSVTRVDDAWTGWQARAKQATGEQPSIPPREPTLRMKETAYIMRNAGETDPLKFWYAMYDASQQ